MRETPLMVEMQTMRNSALRRHQSAWLSAARELPLKICAWRIKAGIRQPSGKPYHEFTNGAMPAEDVFTCRQQSNGTALAAAAPRSSRET